MKNKKPKIFSINQFSESKVSSFLKNVISLKKSQSLIKNGSHISKGNQNRFVLCLGENIIGYFSIIPSFINLFGKKKKSIWWIDLIIQKNHRGFGYQSLVDNFIRSMDALKFGFPNAHAAEIHKKHNWNVSSNFQVLLLPIEPDIILKNSRQNFFMRFVYKTIMIILFPLFIASKYVFTNYNVKWSSKLNDLNPNTFENVFLRYSKDFLITTWRDKAHFNHRYLLSPNKKEMDFYITKKNNEITHYCITRRVNDKGSLKVRILDIFGNFQDHERLKDLIKLVIKTSINQGASQITTLATMPEMKNIFKHCGFLINASARFCWYDENNLIDISTNNFFYWTIGDSDNDEP